MRRNSPCTDPTRPLAAVIALLLLAVSPALVPAGAEAAQPYTCICKGKSTRFLASTRKCERDFGVQSCSRAQFRRFNVAACRANRCSAP